MLLSVPGLTIATPYSLAYQNPGWFHLNPCLIRLLVWLPAVLVSVISLLLWQEISIGFLFLRGFSLSVHTSAGKLRRRPYLHCRPRNYRWNFAVGLVCFSTPNEPRPCCSPKLMWLANLMTSDIFGSVILFLDADLSVWYPGKIRDCYLYMSQQGVQTVLTLSVDCIPTAQYEAGVNKIQENCILFPPF